MYVIMRDDIVCGYYYRACVPVCIGGVVQAGVKHVVLAVSYRAELLEREMKEQETKVYCMSCVCVCVCVTVTSSGTDLH